MLDITLKPLNTLLGVVQLKCIFQKLVPFVGACPELSAYLFNQSNSCQTDIVLHQNENPSEPTCPRLISEESVAADTKSLKMAAGPVIWG